MRSEISDFVDRVFSDPGAAPQWFRLTLVDLVEHWNTEKPVNLIDAAEPWKEWQRC